MRQNNYKSILAFTKNSVRSIASKFYSFDEYDVQEVISMTLVKICQSKSFNPEKGNIEGYVYAIARNTCIDYMKGKSSKSERERPLVDRDSTEDEDDYVLSQKDLAMVQDKRTPESILTSAEEVARIKGSFNLLVDRDSTILHSYTEGLSYDEIAEEQNMTVGNVRRRVFNIRQRLHHALDDDAA